MAYQYIEPDLSPTRDREKKYSPVQQLAERPAPPPRRAPATAAPTGAVQTAVRFEAQRQETARKAAEEAEKQRKAEEARKQEEARKAEEAKKLSEALKIKEIGNIAPSTATREAALAESSIDVAKTKQLQKTAGGLRVGGKTETPEERLKRLGIYG